MLNLQKTYSAILEAAKSRETLTYGDIAAASDVERPLSSEELRNHLKKLAKLSRDMGWPMLISIFEPEGEPADDERRRFSVELLKKGKMPLDRVNDPIGLLNEQRGTLYDWSGSAPEEIQFRSSEGALFVRRFDNVLEALQALGGTGRPVEVINWIKENAKLPPERLRERTAGGKSKLVDEVNFARFYLMKGGLIEAPEQATYGVWSLTKNGMDTRLNDEEATRLFKKLKSSFGQSKSTGHDGVSAPYFVGNIVDDGCFLSLERLDKIISRLHSKKNLVLQGAPGTGKTWLAKRLGAVLIGTNDTEILRSRLKIIQFHPSYSYEDFVCGWRPKGDGGGLSIVNGALMEIVEAATKAGENQPFVLVIEEINRGNPAQIFGEALTLLESSKRKPEDALKLAYHTDDQDRVHFPPNLFVIGTMNIADRSLALVDLALRRRFAFIDLEPQLNEQWVDWCKERCNFPTEVVDQIQRRMTDLNDEISGDRSLGPQFRIGHSYVTPSVGQTGVEPKQWFDDVVETEIVPLLQEYWFDAPDKVSAARRRLLAD
ncbi:AAA family ATPase [Rhizobium leguminosarum]